MRQKKRFLKSKEKRFHALWCALLLMAHGVRTPLPPAPLPLMLTKVSLPTAHGRAPGWQKGAPPKPIEAGSVGRGGAWERTEFSPPGGNGVERTLRRRGSRRAPWAWRSSTAANGAAAGNSGRGCRLTPTPDGEKRTLLSCSPVKTGVLRGWGPYGARPPSGRCFIRGRTP